MADYRTEPAARHHAYIEPTDRRPEEEVEEVVYSLLSYEPGVGLISRSLAVQHTRRTITDIKQGPPGHLPALPPAVDRADSLADLGQPWLHPDDGQDQDAWTGGPPHDPAGDKAYSCRANRAYLRRRGIRAVIPEKAEPGRPLRSLPDTP